MEGLRKNGALSRLSGRQMSVFPQEGNSEKKTGWRVYFTSLWPVPAKDCSLLGIFFKTMEDYFLVSVVVCHIGLCLKLTDEYSNLCRNRIFK